MRKQVYTIQEVARLIRFSDQTIREWVRDGTIKAVRPGLRAWRIPRAEVERLLAQMQIDERVLDIEESPRPKNGDKLDGSQSLSHGAAS